MSFLVPVRDAARYLDEALESIARQDWQDAEILIADDGSSDGSSELLGRWATCEPRIRVFRTGGKGIVAALNGLAGMARGEFLARMDADDVSRPDRLTCQVAHLDRWPDCVAVGSAVELIDADGHVIGPSLPPLRHRDIDCGNLAGAVSMTHPTVLMRRSAFRAVGGYSDDYPAAEDLDLWLRLAEVGELSNLPETLLRYRLHERSVSAVAAERQKAGCRAACEAAWRRRGVAKTFAYRTWRPGADPVEQAEWMLRIGWRAWKAGNRRTWRRYALRAVTRHPLSKDALKLLVLGALRRPDPSGVPS